MHAHQQPPGAHHPCRQIGADYAGKHMLMIGVLKGGFIFTADLARAVDPVPAIMEIDFLKASSYLPGQLETSGVVRLDDGFDTSSVAGKHVLVVSLGRSSSRPCTSGPSPSPLISLPPTDLSCLSHQSPLRSLLSFPPLFLLSRSRI